MIPVEEGPYPANTVPERQIVTNAAAYFPYHDVPHGETLRFRTARRLSHRPYFCDDAKLQHGLR